MGKMEDDPLADLSSWMSDLPKNLQKVPLTTLAIPGSHDSFTYDMHKKNKICKSSISCFLGYFIKSSIIHKLIFKWSITQHLDVLQQLAAGVRYFDIRIAARVDGGGGKKGGCFAFPGRILNELRNEDGDVKDEETREIDSVHGLYCSKALTYLTHIKQFLSEHPKEVVILDFNHFYDMTPQDHSAFTSQVLELFKDMVVPVGKPDSLDLEMMWKGRYQVVAIYWCCVDHDYLYNRHSIRSRWPQKTNPARVLSVLDEEWERPIEGKFKVYQGVLTPSTSYVLMHLLSTLETILHRSGMLVKFVEWVRRRKSGDGREDGGHQMNIFMADFVEVGAFAEAVVNLNK